MPSEDEGTLLDDLRHLLADAQRRRKTMHNAGHRDRKHFGWDEMFEQITEVVM